MDRSEKLGELVPCGGGDPIPLLQSKLVVGRRADCDIVLEFPNVSGHHCQFELTNGYWFVRDLQSRNGIKVNGERYDTKWLQPHDEIAIAKHRFEIVYEPDTDAPPPEDDDPFAVGLLEKAGLARRREQARRLPPAARPVKNASEKKFSPEEDQAMQWLTDGD
ncbi:FHA domain-containing protein [Maioricimonas sp. JC845]|uniref:FHA domain-containing protein n=1 Tax=Maioricimonas sp. JC845 TaxID=3232138 RepID=UPI0034578D50